MEPQPIQIPPSKYLLASVSAGAYTVFAYLLGLAFAGICVGALRITQLPLMIAFTWACPFLVGLLVFHSPILYWRLPTGYLQNLRRIAVIELISVNIVLGIAAPLFDLLRNRYIGIFVDAADATLWLCVAISTLAGLAAVASFYYWLCRNKLTPLVPCLYCPRSAQDNSDLTLPPAIWLPLTLSILLFIAGTAVTVYIQ